MLNIALPKGRLGEKAYRLFEQAGLECPELLTDSRRLRFENPDKGVCYFWVKPADAAIYVARGVADLGVCGKDILMEQQSPVYELMDLGIGACRMAVAAKRGFAYDRGRTLRVATKFPQVARTYYEQLGLPIDIIPLTGSIELAPLLDLSDVIVDIVETGTTLRENDLVELDTIFPISARLIANRAAYQFKQQDILRVVDGLGGAL